MNADTSKKLDELMEDTLSLLIDELGDFDIPREERLARVTGVLGVIAMNLGRSVRDLVDRVELMTELPGAGTPASNPSPVSATLSLAVQPFDDAASPGGRHCSCLTALTRCSSESPADPPRVRADSEADGPRRRAIRHPRADEGQPGGKKALAEPVRPWLEVYDVELDKRIASAPIDEPWELRFPAIADPGEARAYRFVVTMVADAPDPEPGL